MTGLSRPGRSSRYVLVYLMLFQRANTAILQLLAALKQPQNGAAPPVGPAVPAPPPSAGGLPGMSSLQQPPPNPNPYYAHPSSSALQQPPFAGSVPPPNPYSSMPQSSTPQPAQSLPPNLLALLQSAQQQQAQPQLQPPGPTPYGIPPQQMNTPPSNTNPNAQYQQLMAYLVSPTSRCLHPPNSLHFPAISSRRQTPAINESQSYGNWPGTYTWIARINHP